jgi:hypothetical protein
MKTRTWAFSVALALATVPVAAQDAREERAKPLAEAEMTDDAVDEAEADEARPAAKKTIRVLEHPYQIASFYRQRESSIFAPVPEGAPGPYGLAGYYRLGEGARPYGYSRFWTSGYGYSGRDGRGLVVGYRRSIGENGDLFLLMPGFLSPLGPLSGR